MEPKLMTRCHINSTVQGSIKPPAHPEDGIGVGSRNVKKTSRLDTAVCQIIFN